MTASEKSKVIDLTHAVEPHNVAMGAFMLWTAANRFPAGTVHVGMVDTRIGPERQLLAVSAQAYSKLGWVYHITFSIERLPLI